MFKPMIIFITLTKVCLDDIFRVIIKQTRKLHEVAYTKSIWPVKCHISNTFAICSTLPLYTLWQEPELQDKPFWEKKNVLLTIHIIFKCTELQIEWSSPSAANEQHYTGKIDNGSCKKYKWKWNAFSHIHFYFLYEI